jgi:hypothetical protein
VIVIADTVVAERTEFDHLLFRIGLVVAGAALVALNVGSRASKVADRVGVRNQGSHCSI